jgi:hypothetical protein
VALIEDYLSANKSQTLKDEYSWGTKILYAEYNKHVLASLDDVIKACQNIHVVEPHQLKMLDLNMDYYHIKLNAVAQKICTIVFSADKAQVQTITYGYQYCLIPDVFQNVMSKLVQDVEYVKTIIIY